MSRLEKRDDPAMSERRRKIPLVLLALFVAWQAEAVSHLLLVPHTVCKHGKVVEADPESGAPLGNPEDRGDEDGDHEHGGCRFLALLISTAVRTVSAASFSLGPDVSREALPPVHREIVVLHGESRYRLSPSNSPPLAS
jgi:hypothetical protein